MKRRNLQFDSFDQIHQDVERLLQGEYERAGNWDLAQICKHLALAVTGSMADLPNRGSRILQTVMGPFWRWRVFRTKKLPERIPTPKAAVPQPGGDPVRAAKQLQRALERFEQHEGPWANHPMMGKFNRHQWHDFHLIHCAHHLSFLIPKGKVEEG